MARRSWAGIVSGFALIVSACGSGDDESLVSGGQRSGGDGQQDPQLAGGLDLGGAGAGSGATGGGANCSGDVIGILRDFKAEHPDFEGTIATDRGIVEDQLGADGKPVYAHDEGGTETTSGPDNFNHWYRDVAGVNMRKDWLPALRQNNNGISTFEDSSFFPIDGELFGNQGNEHNYHFTFELRTRFRYGGGELFRFRGDDDVFTFINGHLVVDLGGVHGVQEAEVDLDAEANRIGIVPGEIYSLDFFFAERHTTESNFRIDTTLAFVDCAGEPIEIR